MIRGTLWELLDKKELCRLDEAAVRLCAKTGALIEHDGILKKLTDAGCKVDAESGRCLLPEALIRQVISHFKTNVEHIHDSSGGYSEGDRYTGPTHFNSRFQTCHYGSFPAFLDWPECRQRPATKDDVRNMAKMAQMLPEFDAVGQCLTCSEVDSRIEPMWNAVERASLSDKRLEGGEVLYPQHVRYQAEIGRLFGSRPSDMMPACNYLISPLIFGRRDLECTIEKCKLGFHHEPGTMPISGVSAPVTIAGIVALSLAEIMTGWVIGYLLDPSLPACAIIGAGSLDMHTLRACFGSPEAQLQDIAVQQVCRRLYGIKIRIVLDYVDCKTPGIHAAFDKMSFLRAWPFLGDWVGYGAGLLSGGHAYSPVQHLLDMDMLKSWERFAAGFEVNDVTLAVDLVDSVARRRGATFLDTDHTLEHYGSEQWYPRWLDRKAWQGDAAEAVAEKKMLDEINHYWQDAVARYERPAIDEKKLQEARKILKAAEKEMAAVNPAV